MEEEEMIPASDGNSATNKVANNPPEAFPGQKGIIKKGKLFGEIIEYEEINGQAVFQGDILLTHEQLSGLPQFTDDPGARTEGAGRTTGRWPGNVVPFIIDPALPNQDRVREAIAHYHAFTSLHFVPRTSQLNYIVFKPDPLGCSSSLGMVGGPQIINLATGCDKGVVIHEIAHALGIFHEQSRADRDNAIIIHWENILPGKERNFHTYVARGIPGFDHGRFDFKSIMMYHSTAFSHNGRPTITKRDGSLYITQHTALSVVDADIIGKMYPFKWRTVVGGGYKDIDIGANGSAYLIGNIPTPGGYTIYRKAGGGVERLEGGAVSIAVSPTGVPWIVNSYGEIFRRNTAGTGWQLLSGRARGIDIGPDGSIYIIGAALSASGGGYQIWKWNGTGWTMLDGGAEKIAVGPAGVPWIVNSRGEISRRNSTGTGWIRFPLFDTGLDFIPGKAKDIDIGANGAVYIISTLPVREGYKMYKWNGSIASPLWYPLSSGATKISVNPFGMPWITNNIEALYIRTL